MSQRQQRQIAFISQFTTDITYQIGGDNVVAYSLSRVKKLVTDPNCSLTIRKIQWGPDYTSIYCDLTGETLRPIIPSSLREGIFHLFYKPAHPSTKLIDAKLLIGARHVRNASNQKFRVPVTYCQEK